MENASYRGHEQGVKKETLHVAEVRVEMCYFTHGRLVLEKARETIFLLDSKALPSLNQHRTSDKQICAESMRHGMSHGMNVARITTILLYVIVRSADRIEYVSITLSQCSGKFWLQ